MTSVPARQRADVLHHERGGERRDALAVPPSRHRERQEDHMLRLVQRADEEGGAKAKAKAKTVRRQVKSQKKNRRLFCAFRQERRIELDEEVKRSANEIKKKLVHFHTSNPDNIVFLDKNIATIY